LCFGLDLADQQRSGFRCSYSVYQAEYSRNLLFSSGAQIQRVFQRLADRTRSRLDAGEDTDPVRRQEPSSPQPHEHLARRGRGRRTSLRPDRAQGPASTT
ncbi:MAG: hypothetical protein ACRDTT_16565, partial [Pseudonocardiaceae bacterium]